MDSDTLTFLLKQGYLDMRTRVERGVWPHLPLKYADVLRHLVEIIEKEIWFPRVWEPASEDKTVYEGGVIERISLKKYIYHSQRHQAYSSYMPAGEIHKEFNSAESIAKYYLKFDLNLPGDLDGWEVTS